jgi:predicted RNA-binding protein
VHQISQLGLAPSFYLTEHLLLRKANQESKPALARTYSKQKNKSKSVTTKVGAEAVRPVSAPLGDLSAPEGTDMMTYIGLSAVVVDDLRLEPIPAAKAGKRPNKRGRLIETPATRRRSPWGLVALGPLKRSDT